LYTLHVKADNTFEVLIDNKSVRSGSLEDEVRKLLLRFLFYCATITPSHCHVF
jgi:hypothetical protein